MIEVIAEAGLSRTTHRAVAARAGLPLGATTYYFPTLDDLIAAGIQQVSDDLDNDLRTWSAHLTSNDDLPSTLVALTTEYLTDRRRAQIEYEVYVAAARDPAVRPYARAWVDGLHKILTPHVGTTPARTISALLDGAILQSLVTGTPLDAPALTDAIRRLAGP